MLMVNESAFLSGSKQESSSNLTGSLSVSRVLRREVFEWGQVGVVGGCNLDVQ
jgi:hypothetical protein